jgi:hypothetical protein
MFGLGNRPKRECLVLAGRAAGSKVRRSGELGCNLFNWEIGALEHAIHANAANSLLYVSLFTSVANYTLQDAYHDVGLVGPFDPMPKLTFKASDSALMFEEGFATAFDGSADLRRYHDFALSGSLPERDGQMWAFFEQWTTRAAARHFEEQRELSGEWVGFTKLVTTDQVEDAIELLRESTRYL